MRYVVAGVVAIAIFIVGRRSVYVKVKEVVRYDTIRISEPRIDTVYRLNTLFKELRVVDTITQQVIDTMVVEVPITNTIYNEPGLYRAEVSGFQAKLQSIEIYPKTIYQTELIKQSPKWALTITAGGGISKYGLSPTISVGVSRIICSW